jgi:copper(I)-binding protein
MLVSGILTPCNLVVAQQQGQKKGVIFKIPDGYMPMDFPEQKGVLMLHPKKPAGMFVIYPKPDQKSDELINIVRPVLAKMFIHDSKAELVWTEAPLPAHRDVTDESGKLMLTSADKMEVQIAVYTRHIEGEEVVYGHFAMRNSSDKKQSAEFVDASGDGVKDFDKLWKTIIAGK